MTSNITTEEEAGKTTIVMERDRMDLRDLVTSATARIRCEFQGGKETPRKTYYPPSQGRRGRDSAPSAQRSATTTESAPASGKRSRSPGTPTSRRNQEDDPAMKWTRPLNSWNKVSTKFGLEKSRYEDFKFLMYLDIEDPYIQNYVNYTIGIERPKIVGRLKAHLHFWKEIHAPDEILNIIEKGFEIPFISKPPPIYLPNNKSALERKHRPWIMETLREFLDYGFISKVETVPYCVLPLQIAVHPTKLSLIHDESILNDYVIKNRFKLEAWEPMFYNSLDAKYGIQFDLKKLYFHIPIHPDFKKYFGFSFKMNENESVTYFIFNTMPYGYTRAPLIARNLIKPLVKRWRKMNMQISVFFDDGFAVGSDRKKLKNDSIQILCDLLRAGLIPGLEKCYWEPQKRLKWIGLLWDFEFHGISITERRIEKLMEKLKFTLNKWPHVTYREISSINGTINSMYPVFDGREQIRTRFLQHFVNIRHFHNFDWDSKILLTESELIEIAKNEIKFWIENVAKLNFRPFKTTTSNVLGWTDASKNAIGGIITKLNEPEKMHNCLSIDYIRKPACSRYAGINCRAKNWHTDTLCGSAIDLRFDFLKNTDKYTFFHRMLFQKEIEKDSNEREI